ncbi:peptidase S10 [Sphingomonas oleivorans]|uniref:Peptidase S10 n=1 Tax=Sphingomonas oleivorans TaxID=1735121 RepID=A0A2T5FXT9_9SPHN|nr:peptidase S10 [Sphingomonas oleivorans]PTQ10894.1 peptidase S10 [Sphingomonas oleivorans]
MHIFARIGAAALLALSATTALAADDPAPKKEEIALAPLPSDRTIRQTSSIAGRKLAYDATVGSLPVRDEKGKTIGEVVYTAYTVPGTRAAGRPVTFAFNGGPGASSVYLNLGAIGPKRVQFGAEGDAPSDSAVAVDNPGTWLDFTDLVFIDPIGTGFSRSLVEEEKSKKAFYGAKPDIEYLSRIVYDWLVKNGRLTSPKYIVGESYGGYRVPRLAYHLQTQLGVGLNGIVMVSPYLDPTAQDDEGGGTALSPLPWMINLPSMAAGHLERQGKLSEAALRDVETYARGEYLQDFLRGRSDPQAIERMSAKVAAYTGLDPALVRKLQGRVDIGTYLRETYRTDGKIGSVYDSNVTAFDPFPASPQRRSGDPILEALIAPTTSAMVDFVTNQVGYKIDARYYALSYKVNELWDRDNKDEPVTDLRKAIANDGKMGVLIVHGMDDLSCPYFASRLLIDQMPSYGRPDRVKLALYPGGHMFYSRPDSAAAFRQEAMRLYGTH